MPRTKEFDPEEALQKAVDVFWEKGFDSASMEELVEATGASRYGIYSTFGDKRTFFLKAIEQYWETIRKTIHAPLLEPDADLEDLRRFFDKASAERLDGSCTKGCLACRAVVDMANDDPEIDDILTKSFDKVEAMYRQVLQNAVTAGQLSAGVDIGLTAAALAGFNLAAGAVVHVPSTHSRLRSLLDQLLRSLS